MQHIAGFLPLDWDARTGRLYLEIPAGKLNTDVLYTDSLPYGTGSNDLGLDRGQTGRGLVVRFERVGPKVLLVEPNQSFRTSAKDPAEQLAVRQSFPESVLFGFKVEAEDAADGSMSGAVLVDATEFFVRDAHGVAERLARLQQGTYRLDASRSAIALDATKGFPKNTEVEATLTFATDGPGRAQFVRDVTPDAHAMTVREHQSFLELPGPGFVPRRFDPRAGYFPAGYRDYAAPLGEPLDQIFIERHRLVKKDASCVTSCMAVEPIHYYVDRGAPEPIRTALVEGARWWDQAFQAAGWAPGTFLVDVLPEGADPMDVRYNIIQWVHRYTRGWSYGATVTDPRTGEILKGNVTLGSLRGRQDYLIAEALLAPYKDGAAPQDDPMLTMVLARIRQLAAHETGHTLGLAHNFAASSFPHTRAESVSVMDYPHPYIGLDAGGVPEVKQAYATDIGSWDKIAIDYGYRQFAAGEPEKPALDAILEAGIAKGLYFITDEDARPLGSAHPHAHLWDNGGDPAEELGRVMAIRAAALKRFGPDVIKVGTPMAELEDRLVPVYLLERYQTEAAAKEIGGLDYRYALRGDGQMVTKIVAPAEQRKALAAVLTTISPATLTLPEGLLAMLPPRPPALPRTQESFPAMTGLTFDPIAAAEASADMTLGLIFEPARAARLVEYHARDAANPGLAEVTDQTLKAAGFGAAGSSETGSGTASGRRTGLALAVEQAVQDRTVEAMLALAADPAASAEARAVVRAKLVALAKASTAAAATDAHMAAIVERIMSYEKEPEKFVPAKKVEAPPGMPIGMLGGDEDEF